MRNPLLVPDLRELIQAGDHAALIDFFQDQHPARIAEILEDLQPEESDLVIRVLPAKSRAEVMSYLAIDDQQRIISEMSPAEAADLLRLMPHDDRADLVNQLDRDRVDQILRRLAHAEREDIRRLASYEPGTAGAVMTTDYVMLAPGLTVRDALDRIRHEAPDRETIDYSYVVDSQRRLLGLVSLKKLILARPEARIEDVMQRDFVTARLDEDQESVARKIAQYDLIAIPVVDASGMLVGIVTHDDAIDIMRREQTEDILAFGGVSADIRADDVPYWQSGVPAVVRRRINWLMMLFVAESFTGTVLRHYQWVEKRLPDLDLFIPLLIGTGGNAGSQTVGTIIRALALGEVRPRDVLPVVAREWLTGLLLGTLLGGIGFLYAWLFRGQSMIFSGVIALTIVGICVWANTIGSLVPLLARWLRIDPAVVSAPLITTLVDATGLIIYYSIAILLLLRLSGP
jgi:magnesium transporter